MDNDTSLPQEASFHCAAQSYAVLGFFYEETLSYTCYIHEADSPEVCASDNAWSASDAVEGIDTLYKGIHIGHFHCGCSENGLLCCHRRLQEASVAVV